MRQYDHRKHHVQVMNERICFFNIKANLHITQSDCRLQARLSTWTECRHSKEGRLLVHHEFIQSQCNIGYPVGFA